MEYPTIPSLQPLTTPLCSYERSQTEIWEKKPYYKGRLELQELPSVQRVLYTIQMLRSLGLRTPSLPITKPAAPSRHLSVAVALSTAFPCHVWIPCLGRTTHCCIRSRCRPYVASVAALIGCRFPRPQISPSFMKEAYKADFYFQYIGGLLIRSSAIMMVGSRQCSLDTQPHLRQRTIPTRIVHYTTRDGRLHPMAAHPKKDTHHVNKASYNIQK